MSAPAIDLNEGKHCPVCEQAFALDDLCATDIEMGVCHAACLDGAAVVDLESGEPKDGKIDTYRFASLFSEAEIDEMTVAPRPAEGLSIAELQRAHSRRQDEWCPDQKPDLSFRGNELGGECGEAQNVIKKLERERLGMRGSRDTIEHLGEELADVIHCAILVAITVGVDIEKAVVAKFNSTSEKNGLSTFISSPTEGRKGGAA